MRRGLRMQRLPADRAGRPNEACFLAQKKKARQVSLPGLPPPDTSPSSGGGCGASERSADFERVRGAQVVAHDVGAAAAERLVLPVFLAEDVARLEAQGQVRVPHPEDRKSTRLNSSH